MKTKATNLFIYTFYKFISIRNIIEIKKKLDIFFSIQKIRGTVLISTEGINVSISGAESELIECVNNIKILLKIRKLEIKINKVDFLPFNRIKVRIKKEIVSLGQRNVVVKSNNAKMVGPSKWNSIINDDDIMIIDVRNDYETKIGKFKNSLNPKTNNFREFPKVFKKLNIKKNTKIAMYCTGGIRCEKASAFLELNGFKNVQQLQGGILNYLNYIQEYNKNDSLWSGECFVFDNRVTVDNNLAKGNYIQCNGCRHPLTKQETASIHYNKGVTCPYCYSKRTVEQKLSAKSRQSQIELAKKNKIFNPFIKITPNKY